MSEAGSNNPRRAVVLAESVAAVCGPWGMLSPFIDRCLMHPPRPTLLTSGRHASSSTKAIGITDLVKSRAASSDSLLRGVGSKLSG